jgi:hypothetical protein
VVTPDHKVRPSEIPSKVSAFQRQGQGGGAGKANYSHLAQASMRPRCDFGCSCDDISRLVGPAHPQWPRPPSGTACLLVACSLLG